MIDTKKYIIPVDRVHVFFLIFPITLDFHVNESVLYIYDTMNTRTEQYIHRRDVDLKLGES